MREDIIAGLKNAYERGESMPKAMSAFINAGYNRQEVEEAARYVSSLYPQARQTPISIEQKPIYPELPKSPSLTKEIPIAPSTTTTQAPQNSLFQTPETPKKGNKRFIIILSIVLFILLSILGWSAWNFMTKNWVL